MRASTLARVAGATSARPLRTLETVGTETPAARAIFEIVIGVDPMLSTFVEVYEGEYSNDKDDPGGETYKGISRNMNKDFEGWKIIDSYKGRKNYPELLKTDDKLQSLVLDFYKKNYWDKFEGDAFDDETGEEMFDQSVNLGIKRAIEHLQRSLNLLNDRQTLYPDIKVDGIIGDETLGEYLQCRSEERRVGQE